MVLIVVSLASCSCARGATGPVTTNTYVGLPPDSPDLHTVTADFDRSVVDATSLTENLAQRRPGLVINVDALLSQVYIERDGDECSKTTAPDSCARGARAEPRTHGRRAAEVTD